VQKALQDPDPSTRCMAAQTVWRIEGSGKKALPILTAALTHAEDHVRAEAAFSLSLMGADAKEAADALRSALKDPYSKVRRQAAYALVRLDANDGEAATAYVEGVRQSGLPAAFPVTRLAMLRTLAELAAENKEAAALLRELLAVESHRSWTALNGMLQKLDIHP